MLGFSISKQSEKCSSLLNLFHKLICAENCANTHNLQLVLINSELVSIWLENQSFQDVFSGYSAISRGDITMEWAPELFRDDSKNELKLPPSFNLQLSPKSKAVNVSGYTPGCIVVSSPEKLIIDKMTKELGSEIFACYESLYTELTVFKIMMGSKNLTGVGSPMSDLVNLMKKQKKPDTFISIEALPVGLIDGIAIIPDFISNESQKEIKLKMKSFKEEWWTWSIAYRGAPSILYRKPSDTKTIEFDRLHALCDARAGLFSYSFGRTYGAHVDGCTCYVCKLISIFKSPDILDFLGRLVGAKIKSFGEMFASVYGKGDFLTIHHDASKGDYTFVLSLTEDWNPCDGGLTVFLEKDMKTIKRAVSPSFGGLIVFKVEEDKTTHHFVSEIVGGAKRYVFTGWFNVESK